MIEIEWNQWVSITGLCCSLLALVCSAFSFKKYQNLLKKIDAISLVLKDSNKSRERFKSELHELRSSGIGVGRRVMTLEEQLENLKHQFEEMSLQDPDAKLYSRALKMVDLGADIDEIIKECELPQAEVELLMRLHTQEVV